MLLFSLLAWGFLFWYAHNHPIRGVSRVLRGGGGSDEPAPLPTFQSQIPDWAQGLPPEILQYIRQGVGQKLTEPSEYGISSQALQNLLQYQPSQFQYPMEDIQKALAAQQAIQLQQYQQQIRPVLAQQGQLDSTYYANLLGNYLQGQQAQTYGTTADLLTNQATQNYNLQQWLPQFQSNIASQLGNVGTLRSNVNQYNMQYPYSTYIPALSGMYGTGLNQAQQQYNAAMAQWQSDEQQRQKEQEQQAGFLGSLGSLGGMGLGALLALPTGGMSVLAGAMLGGSLGSAASPLWGGSGSSSGLSSLLGNIALSGLGSSLYNSDWNIPSGATSYGGGSWGSSTPYNASGLSGWGNYNNYGYQPQYGVTV